MLGKIHRDWSGRFFKGDFPVSWASRCGSPRQISGNQQACGCVSEAYPEPGHPVSREQVGQTVGEVMGITDRQMLLCAVLGE